MMKRPRRHGNRGGEFLVAGLLLAGGLGFCVAGGSHWFTFQRVAAVPLPPDGSLARLPPLPELHRVDARVVLEGAFRGKYNGVSYDALEAVSVSGVHRPHGCLELDPAWLRPGSDSRLFHRSFTPGMGHEISGTVVTARLIPDRELEDMQLPMGAQANAFEGVLTLELWTRDRSRQGTVAVSLLLLGGLLGGLGVIRASRSLKSARDAAVSTAEPDLLLEQIRKRMEEVTRVLQSKSDNDEFPRERLCTIGEIAEEVARTAAECARLPGEEPAHAYTVCLTRLRETEALLGRIAERIQFQETLLPDLLPELFATLDRELTVLAETGPVASIPSG